MNHQIQQLEASVAALVAEFKNLAGEKAALHEEVARLREQQQNMSQQFSNEQAELRKKHEMALFQTESNLQQVIAELTRQNQDYQAVLQHLAHELAQLIDRLPQERGEVV